MRALAVIAVIVYHFVPRLLPNGYLGVDVFFVISGFVITGSLSRMREARLSAFFLRFFERRVRRLLPALIACVAVTAAVGMPFITPGSIDFTVSWRAGIASLFGMSSLYLYRQSLDYFGSSSAFNLFTQTWSLGVEEQFYLLFPFMAWFCGVGRGDGGTERRFFKALAIGSLISLALFVTLGRTNPAASFLLVTSRFWELGAGAMTFLSTLAWSRRAPPRDGGRAAPIIRSAVLLAVVAVLVLPDLGHVQATLLVVVLTVMLIAVAHRQPSLAGRLLESKPMVFVGAISYSLYLWHWSVLAISRWTVGVRWWTAPFQVGAILLLAYASFSLVEQPLRRRPWLSSRVRNVAVGLAAAAACAIALALLGTALKTTIYLGDVGPNRPRLTGGVGARDGVSRSAAFAGFEREVDDRMQGCNLTPHRDGRSAKPDVNQAFVERCVAGDRPKVVLVGDSFAQMIAPHVALAAHQVGREFRMLIGYEWPYPLDLRKVGFSRAGSCEHDIDLIRTQVVRGLNRDDVMVLRLFFGKPSYLAFRAADLDAPASGLVAAYDAELVALNRLVAERGAHLLIVGANPSVDYTPVCQSPQWFNRWQQRDCERLMVATSLLTRFALQQEAHLVHLLSGGAGGDALAQVVTPTSILCPTTDDGACPLVRDGEYLWGDEHHIKLAAVDLFYPQILRALRRWSP